MPRVNIYIRQEDWPTWNTITNKPEWLSLKLKQEQPEVGDVPVSDPVIVCDLHERENCEECM